MKTIEIKQGELLSVRGTQAMGLTPSGRKMVSPIDQEVEMKSPNVFYNIRLKHIVGPLKGVTIFFMKVEAKRIKEKNICSCSAYLHPHATGRGKCQKKVNN